MLRLDRAPPQTTTLGDAPPIPNREPYVQRLADEIRVHLADPRCAFDAFRALEAREEHSELIAAARSAAASPLWDTSPAGTVGLVVGSGGVSRRTPNISTAAALTASCVPGVLVAKPGSVASMSRRLGPAGLADRLGIRRAQSGAELLDQLGHEGFALFSSDECYPWLAHAELFTIGFFAEAVNSASLSPCSAAWKVNGVVRPDWDLHLARCRHGLVPRTLIVHGSTDDPEFVLDDASTAGTTEMLLVGPEGHHRASVEPENAGARRVAGADLVVPDGVAPEDVFTAIVEGRAPRTWIELVTLSTAIILITAQPDRSLREEFAHAGSLLRDGVVAEKLRRLQARACS